MNECLQLGRRRELRNARDRGPTVRGHAVAHLHVSFNEVKRVVVSVGTHKGGELVNEGSARGRGLGFPTNPPAPRVSGRLAGSPFTRGAPAVPENTGAKPQGPRPLAAAPWPRAPCPPEPQGSPAAARPIPPGPPDHRREAVR